MMPKELTCICCPQGCRLTVEKKETSAEYTVTGNRCPRGENYAKQELTDPRRVVTAVVKTENGGLPYLPVRTDAPLPKKMIERLLNRLYIMRVALPVKRGSVIISDVEHTGVNVIASEDAE